MRNRLSRFYPSPSVGKTGVLQIPVIGLCLFSILLFYPGHGMAQSPPSSPPSDIEIGTEPPVDLPFSPIEIPTGTEDSTEREIPKEAPQTEDLNAEQTPLEKEAPDGLETAPPQLGEKSLMRPDTIRMIHVTGNTLLTGNQIAEVTNPFLGQALNLETIKRLADAVTYAYHQRGFFLAKAYLPEQEIQQGRVVIAVLEGTIGKVVVTGNEYYPTPFIEKHFLNIHEPRGANLNALRRSRLVLGDYTDLKANVLLKRGEAPETADMEVQIQDHQPVHLALDYNNWGSSYISRDRFGMEADIGNLIADGHLLSLKWVIGSPVRDMTLVHGGYTAPWGYTGRNVHFSYTRGDFDVGREFEQLDIRMKTEAMNLSVSYPFFQTDRMGLTGEAGIRGSDFTQMVLGAVSNRDRIRVVTGQLDYNRVSENTRDFVSLQLSQGLGHLLGGLSHQSLFVSRLDADNQFTKGTVEAVRIRSVPEPYWLFHPFSVILRGGLQVSSDNLVVGEQFVLGGPDSVRGYGNGEFLGDHGYRVSGELRMSPMKDDKYLQAALFLDHGGSFIKSKENEDHYLTGIGWGLRFNFPKTVLLRAPGPETPGYVLESQFQVRADVAYPLDPRPSSSGKNPVYYLYAVERF